MAKSDQQVAQVINPCEAFFEEHARGTLDNEDFNVSTCQILGIHVSLDGR